MPKRRIIHESSTQPNAMKTQRIFSLLIVAMVALTGLPSAFACKAAANRAYVSQGSSQGSSHGNIMNFF